MGIKKWVDGILSGDAGAESGDMHAEGQLQSIWEGKTIQDRLEKSRLITEARFSGRSEMVPPIGKILNDMGAVDTSTLEKALSRQEDMIQQYCDLAVRDAGTIRELGTVVNASLDFKTVLSLIVENAKKVTRAEAGTLFLVDEKTDELVFSVPTGPTAKRLVNMRVQWGEGVVGWVAKHETPLVVPDVSKDSRFNADIDVQTGFTSKSLLCVPLMLEDRLIGVLETVNKIDGSSFSEEDAVLLTVFAEQAATAINNARVHTALKTQLEEIRRTQDRLVEEEKFRALENLSAGMSHDFKNLLNAILGFAEIVFLDVKDEQIRKDIVEIMNAGNSALDLVNQFLSFSRSQKQRRVPVEIDRLMSRSIKLVRMSMPETAEIRYTLDAGNARLDGDPSQIHMAVMNVLDNAAESIGEFRGEIAVETSIAMLSDEDAIEFPSLTPGPYAKILIRDNGCGMAEDIQKRIFEPYFTTKQEGVGKGMGLPTARGIIRSHKGLITNASIPGEGTVFQILLPVTVEEDYESPKRLKNLPRGEERILVVDDEALISATMKKMLMFLGYEVSLVKTAEEAWEAFEKASVRPDLVITDWALPDLPGDALAEKIRKKYPSAQVILYSAFSDEFDDDALKGRGIAELLGKPVEFELLAETVRAVLDDTD